MSVEKSKFQLSLVLLACILFIFLPLFAPGYLFAPDMIFTPSMQIVQEPHASYIFQKTLEVLAHIIPADILQKILLTGIFLLAGFGFMRLAKEFLQAYKLPISNAALLFAGLFGIFNPFVYSRFMIGQYSVLFGYALVPFFVVSLVKFLHTPTWKSAGFVSLWAIAISIVSIHTLGLLAVIAIPLTVLYLYRQKSNKAWLKQFSLKVLSAIGLFAVASSYWLIPTLLGNNNTADTIQSFSSADFAAFATHSQYLGVIGNILAMQGFWGDVANLYLIPQDRFGWWFIPVCLLWALVLFGAYSAWQKRRDTTMTLIIMLVAALLLSIGTAGTFVAPLNQWLVENVPLFAGYREPQKFIAIVIVVYTIFATIGVQEAVERLKQHKKADLAHIFSISVLIIPIATAPLMLWGFAGQVKPAHYPEDWYRVEQYFDENVQNNQKILGLPWHMYTRFDFANRVIANPMDKFFGPHVIISADPEFEDAQSYNITPEQKMLNDVILPNAPERTDLGSKLAQLNIGYILLSKEGYNEYKYLQQQQDLTPIYSLDNLTLYKVTADPKENAHD